MANDKHKAFIEQMIPNEDARAALFEATDRQGMPCALCPGYVYGFRDGLSVVNAHVYVALVGEEYEGYNIVGIFSTWDAAREFLQKNVDLKKFPLLDGAYWDQDGCTIERCGVK